MRPSHRQPPTLLAIALLAVAGCQLFAPFSSAPTSQDSGDGAAELGLDAAVDGAADSAPDTVPDSAPDSAADSTPDALEPGSHLWSRGLGHRGVVHAMKVAFAPGGDTIVSGSFAGAIDLGCGYELTSAGGKDIFLASFDPGGTCGWCASFGGPGADAGRGVAVDSSGNTFVTGGFEGTVSLGGGALSSAGGKDIFVASFTAGGGYRWARRFGGDDDDEAVAVAIDAGGDVALTGEFRKAVDFGSVQLTGPASGQAGVFVASCAGADGAPRWAQQIAASGDFSSEDVVSAASGNVTVVGYFAGTLAVDGTVVATSAGGYDAFVASYGADGTYSWSQSMGADGGDEGHGVAVDASGNVTVAGHVAGDVDLGGGTLTGVGGNDVFLASYDADGGHRWSSIWGGGGHDAAYAVATDATGNVTVTGLFRDSGDFGGNLLTSVAASDIFIASFTAEGLPLWSRAVGCPEDAVARSIAARPGGAVSIAGTFRRELQLDAALVLHGEGGSDVLLASFTAGGGHLWARNYASSAGDLGAGIALDSDDNVALTGRFYGRVELDGEALQSAGATDAFFVGLDPGGGRRWSREAGAIGLDEGSSVAFDASGNAYVTGYFAGSADLGGGPLTGAGLWTAFVASFDADGNHRWSKAFGGTNVSGFAKGHAVAVAAGHVFVVGHFAGPVDFGAAVHTAAGTGDLFVARLSAVDGGTSWAVASSGAGAAQATGVALDDAGHALITGFYRHAIQLDGAVLPSTDDFDALVVSLDAGVGTTIWAKSFGGPGLDMGSGIAAGPGDAFYVAGTFDTTIDFGGGAVLTSAGPRDGFLASLDAVGTHRWSLRFGGDESTDSAQGVAVGPDGLVYLVGAFSGAVDLGGDVLTSTGSQDILVASFTAAGTHRWSRAFGSPLRETGAAIAVGESAVVITGAIGDPVDFDGSTVSGVGAAFAAAFVP